MGIIDRPFPLEQLFTKNDEYSTESSTQQSKTEKLVYDLFKVVKEKNSLKTIRLNRIAHIKFATDGLKGLHKHWVVLDANKPWLCYWMLHVLDLLGHDITQELISRGVSTISKLQNATGGFGGGPAQISHAAVTYAAVNTIAILGTKEAYDLIDRESLYKWFMKLKQPDGSFIMHEGGEVDIRGAYCVLASAALTNLITPELIAGTADWIRRCQAFDGGIGGEPGLEAHGGYAFCGLAAMEILGKTDLLDVPSLFRWASSLQMQLEGGFQGRPNKLVDGCYSFWVGALFPILEIIMTRQQLKKNDAKCKELDEYIEALQEYLLIACQYHKGGLIDKPKRSPDYYHTCYCLSGLSTSQHHVIYDFEKAASLNTEQELNAGDRSLLWSEDETKILVLGDPSNVVNATHPIHNVTIPKAKKMIEYFRENPFSS
ncbi:1718_t:CDS:10 [Gigaspora margarita]|uniref:Protein farnesyltransferase subunit beta n=1 Tax=Gigaspora margarita TaxID=4874 RepID=A0ABN7W5J7_GIGMA|nr:1718_t:CDS:10 [Gigaspora margarita]